MARTRLRDLPEGEPLTQAEMDQLTGGAFFGSPRSNLGSSNTFGSGFLFSGFTLAGVNFGSISTSGSGGSDGPCKYGNQQPSGGSCGPAGR